MKTIEERGLRYIETQCKGCNNENKRGRYIGYIQGAKEQKAIDIEKACEMYEKVLIQMKRILNEIKNGAGDIISLDDSLIHFRKAMED